jgi:membrane-bound ClpP family serine protease
MAWFASTTAGRMREVRARIGGGAAGGLAGYEATVESLEPGAPGSPGLRGKISVRGELWDFECAEPLQVGELVRIDSTEGLLARVSKPVRPSGADKTERGKS